MISYLVQDIETIPEAEVVDLWVPKDGDSDEFPPIWCHKIACIGMLVLDENFIPKKGGCAAEGLQGGSSESEMISRWSEIASGAAFKQKTPLKMVDYNGRRFDVPVLQTRAFRYGIQLPWYLGLRPDNNGKITAWSKEYRDRYSGCHLDVQELWTGRGGFSSPPMASLAQLMGLPGKIGIDGSKVYQSYKDGDYAGIDIYCMQDVYQTAFIFQRFQYLAGKIGLDSYRVAATSLLEFIEEEEVNEEFLDMIDRGELLIK